MNEGFMNQVHDVVKAANEREEIAQHRDQAYEVLQRMNALFPMIHVAMIQKVPFWLHRWTDWERIAQRAHEAAMEAANAQAFGWRRFREGIETSFPCQCDECISRRLKEEEEAQKAQVTAACPTCNGTGQDPNNWPYDCPTCRRAE